MDAKALRAQAAECRRLAHDAKDCWVRESYLFLAQVCDEEADALEQRKSEAADP